MQDLRVSIVQGETRWHDPAGNRDYYGRLIAPLAGRSDVIVLPETEIEVVPLVSVPKITAILLPEVPALTAVNARSSVVSVEAPVNVTVAAVAEVSTASETVMAEPETATDVVEPAAAANAIVVLLPAVPAEAAVNCRSSAVDVEAPVAVKPA